MVSKNVVLSLAALALLAAAPGFAVDVIQSGADLWQSFQGVSYTDFADDPIPANFFCPGSKPFTGRIAMQGSPLATEPAGVLGPVDTVVRRLDDATFDERGVATTRIQLMALSMVGTEPIDAGCGQPFAASASLDGEQPTTVMRIVRQSEDGGTYAAPLKLNVKLAFTPVGSEGKGRLQVRREISLGPAADSYWATTDKIGTTGYGKPVRIDTDGDGAPDAALPGSSNFAAGLALAAVAANPCPVGWCPGECCHCTPRIYQPKWDEPLDNCRPDPDDPTQPDPRHLHCVFCCKPCYVEPEPVEPVEPVGTSF
jgi:hypothetical protein